MSATGAKYALQVQADSSEELVNEPDNTTDGSTTSLLQKDSMSKEPRNLILSRINTATKWGVSGLVCLVLLWRHDRFAAWCVLGSILSSFVCKALKYLINEQRPPNARKADPGMPSSHANSLSFLSVYAAVGLVQVMNNHAAGVLAALAVLAAGLFLTWLRVALGYHTWAQVVVGAALGACSAILWYMLGDIWVVSALTTWPPGLPLLYGTTAMCMVLFAAYNLVGLAHSKGWFVRWLPVLP